MTSDWLDEEIRNRTEHANGHIRDADRHHNPDMAAVLRAWGERESQVAGALIELKQLRAALAEREERIAAQAKEIEALSHENAMLKQAIEEGEDRP